MTEPAPNAADATGLQFDQAEFSRRPAAGLPVCAACQQTIPDQYFQVSGQILCEGCRTSIQAQLTGGSPFRRFFKAGIYGFGAAIAGFAIYFGVMKLTGLEIGLISILVGYMVGAAVRSGSEARGGWLYQLMAVGFAYLAISVSYSALIIPKMIEQFKADAEKVAAQPNNAAKADPAAAGNPNEGGDAKAAVPDQPVAQPAAQKELTAADFAIAIGLLFGFVLAMPVLVGFSQPIGLLIVGFALWEAFKMNRKIQVVITGPHNVGPALDQAPSHV